MLLVTVRWEDRLVRRVFPTLEDAHLFVDVCNIDGVPVLEVCFVDTMLSDMLETCWQ